MNKKVKNIILCVVLLIASVVYTIIVMKVDVKPIGPQNSLVGLASVNKYFKDIIGNNMTIYKVTEYVGYIPILLAGVYAVIGFVQLIKRKSLKKVDKEIYILACFYVLVLGVYLLFEKLVINYRPVLMEGLLDPSYPSSHTILALCFCGSSIIINNILFKKSKLAKCENVLSVILIYVITIGRFVSGVHWFSDIIGGIIISLALLQLFKTMIILLTKKDYKVSILKVFLIILGFIICTSVAIYVNYELFNKVMVIDNIKYNADGIPIPEVTDGIRGELGIDKNVNEITIDKYLGRSDSVYRDMRMLYDPADYAKIGGNAILDGLVEGFEVVPLPYIIPVNNLPKEVGETYKGKTLFRLNADGSYSPNYKESLEFIEKLFPKNKYIFLMCGGGGYAGMMKKFLVSLGWNENKIWVVGGYWYYTGEHNIKLEYSELYDEPRKFTYHEIDFNKFTTIRNHKNGLIELTDKYYDPTEDFNSMFNQIYIDAYDDENAVLLKDDERRAYANQKQADYIDSLLEKKENFIIIFHDYYDTCSDELNLYDIADQIRMNDQVYFYMLDPDVYKKTSLFENYRFIPGVLIIKEGTVYQYIDGNHKLTKQIYDAKTWDERVKLLRDWINKYVVI